MTVGHEIPSLARAGVPVSLPRSLAEAYALLGAGVRGLRVLAGGTDFLPSLADPERLSRVGHVLGLSELPELRGVRVEQERLIIGALTTYDELAREVRERLPGLSEAAARIEDAEARLRGTIGGGICGASPFADLLPLFVAADARFVLGGPRGERTVAADGFFVARHKTALAADELLLRVELPLAAGARLDSRKRGFWREQSSLVIALYAGAGDPRVAAGGIGAKPLRCRRVEAALRAGEDPAAALASDLASADGERRLLAQSLLAQLPGPG